MRSWIVRLWFGFIFLLGLVLTVLFIWDVNTATADKQPPPVTIEALQTKPNIRWIGLDKPPRLMRTFTADLTAYSPSVDETDSSPCETANGTSICGGDARYDVIAINGLPMGTKVWSSETGFRVVSDRMNERYGMGNADIPIVGEYENDPRAKAEAKKFGLKRGILFTIID